MLEPRAGGFQLVEQLFVFRQEVGLLLLRGAGRDGPRHAGQLAARSDEFAAVENALTQPLSRAHEAGLHPTFSAIFKTPAEVTAGSPLFLDMLDDARIVFDRDGFLREAFDAFATRLARLGARRIWRGEHWFWDLKPDYKPGDVFEL